MAHVDEVIVPPKNHTLRLRHHWVDSVAKECVGSRGAPRKRESHLAVEEATYC